MISIKEVTKQTGITVRTMRYYDHIGILPPADKTEGGHRMYGEKELKKLQEIQFLKTLGFRLQEIKEMLADEHHDWSESLQNQLNYVAKEKQKLEEMERTLYGLRHEITLEGHLDLTAIQKLIHLYQQNRDKREVYRDQFFHDDEKELLARMPNINSGDPDTLEWISLLAQIKKHRSKGAASEKVQRIIRRMHEKEKEMFGDQEAFSAKFWEVRKSPEKSEQVGLYPIDPEILEFIAQASNIYLQDKNQHHTDDD